MIISHCRLVSCVERLPELVQPQEHPQLKISSNLALYYQQLQRGKEHDFEGLRCAYLGNLEEPLEQEKWRCGSPTNQSLQVYGETLRNTHK